MSLEIGHRNQVGRKIEDAVELVLRPGAPRLVDPERANEGGEDEADGEDDPRQDRRGAGDRLQRHGDVESLSRLHERAAHGRRAPEISSGGAADGELHRRRVSSRRAQRGFRHEQHDERRYAGPPDGGRSELGEKEPLLAVVQGCQRGCAHGIKRPRAGQRRSHAGFAAEIDPRQVRVTLNYATGGTGPAVVLLQGAVDPGAVAEYAAHLRRPGHLGASYAYFRTFHGDAEATIRHRETPLAMPVLAIGGEGALGQAIPDQMQLYAGDVTGAVFPAVTGSRRKARNRCSSTCCRSSASPASTGRRRHAAPVRPPGRACGSPG